MGETNLIVHLINAILECYINDTAANLLMNYSVLLWIIEQLVLFNIIVQCEKFIDKDMNSLLVNTNKLPDDIKLGYTSRLLLCLISLILDYI